MSPSPRRGPLAGRPGRLPLARPGQDARASSGESGSGKTVLSRAIMGLLPLASTTQTGSVRYDGQKILNAPDDQLRKLWSTHIAMVFQDPMTSLNPVQRIGNQITEPLRIHLKLLEERGQGDGALPADAGGHSLARRALRRLSGPALGRHAPARHDRHRLGLRPAPADGGRAHHRPRRHRAGPDPRPAGPAAARPRHGHDPGHPRPRRGGHPDRRDHRDVRRQRGGAGADQRALQEHGHALHRGAAASSTPRIANPSHTRLTAIEGRPPDLLNPPSGCPFSPRCPYAQEKCHLEKPPLVEASPGPQLCLLVSADGQRSRLAPPSQPDPVPA